MESLVHEPPVPVATMVSIAVAFLIQRLGAR
jgi:hypothetical protein